MELGTSISTQRRPDIARAFDHLAQSAQPLPGEDTIAAMRRFVDRYGDVEPRAALAGCEVRRVSAAGVPAEWIIPAALLGEARVVLLHGGGWVAGGLESHRPIAATLARMTGLAVLLVDYRLAPEHPFPAGFEDCRAAFGWAVENGPDGKTPAREVYLVGDSAGGNLSAALCIDAIASGARAPDRVVMMSPPVDGSANPARGEAASTSGDQAALAAVMSLYLPTPDQLLNPRVSPILAAGEMLAQFPPTLIQASNAEFLIWDADAFAKRLMENGARVNLSIWRGLPHVWQAFITLLPEAREALAEAAHFLTARSSAS